MKYFILSALIIFFALPLTSMAALPLPGYGGYVVAAVPCTCPPFGYNIYYAPFYPTKTVGTLTLTMGTFIPYAYEQFIVPYPTPTTWQLGDFVPGAGVCLVGAPPACAPLPSLGMIFQVGASFPGHTPAG